MRSRTDYVLTKSQVQAEAEQWLAISLRLEYEGYKCTTSVLLQIFLIAAARAVSLFPACRDLADAPSDQTIRNALAATLPETAELQRRLNLALVTRLPKELQRKSQMVAFDLTLNQRRRLTVIAELDRLMTMQLDPDFTGNVEVLVPAKNGRIGEPQFAARHFGIGPGG